MKTRQDLIYRALKNLGVLPSGQDPSDEERNSVAELIDPMVEDLIARDVYFLRDADAVPDEAFMHLGHVLASCAAAEFGMQNDQAIAARGLKAEMDLERIQSMRPTYSPLKIHSY